MDTLKTPEQVAEVLQVIKTKMPNTYEAVRAKADEIGSQAYSWVRAGIRGEPNRFYAVEAGYVVGTPFAGHRIEAQVAALMCNFGTDYVCIWPSAKSGAQA